MTHKSETPPSQTENQQKPDSNLELFDYKIEKILYNFHQIFLYGVIDEKMTLIICEELVAMDAMNRLQFGQDIEKYIPITIRIWSPGGYVTGGFAIIDTMNSINTPTVTMVTGQAASMASLITINGDYRIATKNSDIMFHPMSGGSSDYQPYQRDYFRYSEQLDGKLWDFVRAKTKLGQKKNLKYLQKAQNGELWLNGTDALKLGVVDNVI